MLPFNMGAGGASGAYTGDIGHSLRFRGTQYLSRTITTDTTSTYAMKVKRGKLGVISPIIETYVRFNANDTLTAFGLTTTAVFRDPTAWILIHISNNGLYVNGQSLGAVTTSAITNGRIGYDGTNYFDGYMARFCVVGGSAAAYTNFDYFNTEINEWVSKSQSAVKAVVDAGGTNSFMLDFDDATSLTTLGYDKSSKGNNWTLNNFSLTAGTTYDHMLDVPGNSFATWNPLFPTTNTISNGNLRGALAASVNAGYGIRSTIPMVSGKYEAEFVPAASADSWSYVGVCPASLGISDVSSVGSNAVLYRAGNGNKNVSGTATAYGASWTTEAIRIAVDMDARTVTFYKAGVSQGSISLPSSTENYVFVMSNGNATTFTADANFGQQPITLDSGYKALCQRNMPDPAILNPEKHFDVDIYTGTGSAINRTGFQLQPDLIWIKGRQSAYSHAIFDSVRGVTKVLNSNTTDADYTESAGAGLTAFNADGYSLGTNGADASTNVNSQNFVTWLWKAGGAAVTNNAGSISSQVSANVEAGFSIVTYTGTGANATVGHGLGKAPGLVIVKGRNTTASETWCVQHQALSAGTYFLRLNETAAVYTAFTNRFTAFPTSSVIQLGNNTEVCENTKNFVAYCFAEIPGFSKIFSYTGNGSADGPFVHCGFKPKYVLIKSSSASATDWLIFDCVRNTYNVMNLYVGANLSSAEFSDGAVDAVSNGFKIRTTGGSANTNAATYIGIAFADVTAKYSLAR